jgi:hypothetical protein
VKFTATGQRDVNIYRPTHVELLVDSVGDINPYSTGTGGVTEASITSFDEYEIWYNSFMENTNNRNLLINSQWDGTDSGDLTPLINIWTPFTPTNEIAYFSNSASYQTTDTKWITLEPESNVNPQISGADGSSDNLTVTFKGSVPGVWNTNLTYVYIKQAQLKSGTLNEGSFTSVNDFTSLEFDLPDNSESEDNLRIFRLSDTINISYSITIEPLEGINNQYFKRIGQFLLMNEDNYGWGANGQLGGMVINTIKVFDDQDIILTGSMVDENSSPIGDPQSLILNNNDPDTSKHWFVTNENGNIYTFDDDGYVFNTKEFSVYSIPDGELKIPSKYKVYTQDDIEIAEGSITTQIPWQSLDTLNLTYKFKGENNE